MVLEKSTYERTMHQVNFLDKSDRCPLVHLQSVWQAHSSGSSILLVGVWQLTGQEVQRH